MSNPMNTEPAVTIGGISAAVTAIIALLVAFGVNVSQTQQAAILGVVAVLAPFLVAVVTRGFVWSPHSVDTEVATAKREARAAGYDAAVQNFAPPLRPPTPAAPVGAAQPPATPR